MTSDRGGIVAIVGRPNVGKSTLFNRLCRSRDALVHNRAGLTRDRKYGTAKSIPDASVTLIDTGGLHDEGGIGSIVDEQVQIAVDESDLVLFTVDARAGLTSDDQVIAKELRRSGTPTLLVVNKIDGVSGGPDNALSEFAPLGFSESLPVSASHGNGFRDLTETIVDELPVSEDQSGLGSDSISVAVLGRPNVGKSTLVNALCEEERCIVFDQPGTTRDANKVRVKRDDNDYELIDTAGIRRKGSVDDVIEKFSIVKALDALRGSSVALLVIDASEGIVEQDLHLVQFAVEAGSGVVLVVNKWDLLDADGKERCRNALRRRLRFAEWVQIRYVSAISRTKTTELFGLIERIHGLGELEVAPSDLTSILDEAVSAHPPPVVKSRTIKLRYAHKAGSHPPTIVVHGNQTRSLPASYKRYVENFFRQKLGLVGWPVVIHFRTSENPFKDRKNQLTERQQRRRQRLIRHRKS